MKIIFLDFNGVLDTYEDVNEINQENLMHLKRICEETNSKVVISSSLKNNSYNDGEYSDNLIKYFINPLQEVGIDVIGITPNKNTRQEEIEAYLNANPNIENFCILDDEFTFDKYKDHFVKLPYLGDGLEEKYVEQAISILKENKKTLTK